MTDSGPKFSKSECATGLTRFLCDGPPPDPAKLVGRLAKLCPAYLVIHPASADVELTEEMEPEPLFDWLPEDARQTGSPMVVCCKPSRPQGLVPVKPAWGKDSLVCFYSRRPSREILKTLRRASRAGGAMDKPPRALTGLCWPASLQAMLSDGSRQWVEQLFGVVDVALMEGPDGAGWQAFSLPEFSTVLAKLGFVEVSSETH